ncbi:MAG TPA: alpha/beta fold hydrolase [Anaerolineaceae bacterium]
MIEKAILFGRFHSLVGILTEPDAPIAGRPVVVLSNAGLIHRIGPNRIYVKLARALAGQGFTVLRFDISGVGDSLPRPDHMAVENFIIDDVQQALEYLAAETGTQSFILGGHCAGAYHSIRTAAQDPRVRGVVMINPDGGEADWREYDKRRKLAQYYENYYGKKTLADPQRWKRFLTFRVNYRKIFQNIFQNVIWSRAAGLWFRVRRRFEHHAPTQADEMLFTVESILRKLPEIPARALMVYSENSTSLERVQSGMGKEMKQLHAAGKLDLAVIAGADHIFSPVSTQADLFETITGWIEKNYSN